MVFHRRFIAAGLLICGAKAAIPLVFTASIQTGGFEPLRFPTKGNKVVVVGVITSKFGELEKEDEIKRRLAEASKFAPLVQLALSPQCGFAPTEEGNILSEEEQWAKLKLAVDVANEVRGSRLAQGCVQVSLAIVRPRSRSRAAIPR